jgi:hypothetical protein
LLAVSATDGRPLAAYELGAMPVFDGLAAAGGRLYLSTVDGQVLCLGPQGSPLAPAAPPQLAPLDVTLQESPVPPANAHGPSKAEDFDHLAGATVTAAELGYHLHAAGKPLGMALRKLSRPLAGKVQFQLRMRPAGDGNLKNCFLLFGDGPDEAQLVQCGFRFAMRQAMIVQGSKVGGRPVADPGSKTVPAPFDADPDRTYDVTVDVDLGRGEVTLRSGAVKVTAGLRGRLEKIDYLGYGVMDAAADFSPVETSSR